MQGKNPMSYHKGQFYGPYGSRRPVNTDHYNSTGTGIRVDYDSHMSLLNSAQTGTPMKSTSNNLYPLGRAGERDSDEDNGMGSLSPVRPPMRPDTGTAAKKLV
jgi:hypothetical protein